MNDSDEIFFAEEEETVAEGEKWKILIADDEPGVHAATKIALEDFSLEGKTLDFLSAYSGEEAIRMLEEHSDIVLVLLDVVMETDDAGLRVVKQIREEMNNQHVRVILRTGQAGRFPEESVIVDYDVNDYKTKTELTTGKLFSSVVTSIRAYKNILELHEHREHLEELVEKRSEELRQTIEKLAYRNEELHQEQEFAQKIFTNIVNPGFLDAVNIKYLLSPMSVFNGDLLLVEQDMSRGQFVMLGDFTGHGLKAALGAIPVAETFRSMVKKGFSIEDIVSEINRKLKAILPVGVFLCACVIHVDTMRNKLSIWNGSLPDLLVYRDRSGIVARAPSSHLAMGIVGADAFDKTIEVMDILPGDRIYVYSDGITEAENVEGQMFGEERLEECFTNENENPDHLFDYILDSVRAFVSGKSQGDDITIVEVSHPLPVDLGVPAPTIEEVDSGKMMKWKMVMVLNTEVLRTADPVPMLLQLVVVNPDFERHRSNLLTLVSELLNNSLDHGVLGLASSLKNEPEGFALYYRERKKALAFLEEGWIRVDMEHTPLEKGGRFTVIFEDSGPGFDYEEALSLPFDQDPTRFSGRGIMILQNLCDKLEYSGTGNHVKAVYDWR